MYVCVWNRYTFTEARLLCQGSIHYVTKRKPHRVTFEDVYANLFPFINVDLWEDEGGSFLATLLVNICSGIRNCNLIWGFEERETQRIAF